MCRSCYIYGGIGERRIVVLERKVISGIMLALMLMGMLTLAFNIQPVKASGTIYIQADGSIDPVTANITTSDCITYTFTGNIYDSIVIWRSNITIDGNEYTLQGSGGVGYGFDISNARCVTIRNTNINSFLSGVYAGLSYYNILSGNNITGNTHGIVLLNSFNSVISGNNITANDYGFLFYGDSNTISENDISANAGNGLFLGQNSFNNIISGNNITANGAGISLDSSSNNSISGNDIINNWDGITMYSSDRNSLFGNNIASTHLRGIQIWYSEDNLICHNNFVGNTQQVKFETPGCDNIWDDGYPSGGNYWSDYTAVDSNFDGIGDTQYVIDPNNIDNYPLMGQFSDFTATPENHVQAICNSIISGFQFNGTAIIFNVSGEVGTTGFCRICIPTALICSPLKVLIDEIEIPYTLLPCSNNTHSYLYFTYVHSTHEIVITSETPPPTYALTITTTGGTTTPAPGTYTYTANASVQVTAIPNTNYLFDHWELDTVNVGSANPYTVLMNKNHTLKAIFSHARPAVPVGGYSIPIKAQNTPNPLTLYLALTAILATVFTAIRRKTPNKK
jgi:parallel beta-helix repeat protein